MQWIYYNMNIWKVRNFFFFLVKQMLVKSHYNSSEIETICCFTNKWKLLLTITILTKNIQWICYNTDLCRLYLECRRWNFGFVYFTKLIKSSLNCHLTNRKQSRRFAMKMQINVSNPIYNIIKSVKITYKRL